MELRRQHQLGPSLGPTMSHVTLGKLQTFESHLECRYNTPVVICVWCLT